MNPHSKGGHAAVGRACSAPGCHTVHFARGWCRPHYMRWYNQQRANGVAPLTPLASPPPPFPRRIIVADYCRTCGCPVCSWGCTGGARVYWRDRPVSATMDGKSEARAAQTVPGPLSQKPVGGVPHA